MISLGNTLKVQDILLQLKSEDVPGGLIEIAGLLRNDRRVSDWPAFLSALEAKAQCGDTKCGICIPHARTDAVQTLVMACGRSNKGLKMPGIEERIHYIFVVGVPHALVAEYLRVIGALARLVRDKATETKLRNATTAEEFHGILAGGETKL